MSGFSDKALAALAAYRDAARKTQDAYAALNRLRMGYVMVGGELVNIYSRYGVTPSRGIRKRYPGLEKLLEERQKVERDALIRLHGEVVE